MSNSVVLDPFGGSGSTLIACEQTHRICRMVELDEKYCDVIVHRIIQYKKENDKDYNPDQEITLIRGGKKYKLSEVEINDGEK